MRTTIVVDDSLLDDLMRIEPGASRSEAIRRSIESHVRRRREDEFMALAGSGLVDLDWRVAEKHELAELSPRGARRRRRGRTR
jgi:metal-responsive CopG/Arc/MetJ family transcriptional regulator